MEKKFSFYYIIYLNFIFILKLTLFFISFILLRTENFIFLILISLSIFTF